MSAAMVDPSWLGSEDARLHQALLQAGSQVHCLVQSIFNPVVTQSKLQLNNIDRQIKDLLASMRGHIRDLELSSEEQETWVNVGFRSDDVPPCPTRHAWHQPRDEEAQAVEACLRAHKADYESLRQALSTAQLVQMQRTEAQFSQQRKELLSGANMGVLQRQFLKESDAVAGAQDITSGLMRTRQVLAEQLEQTAGNMELLDTGNTVLAKAKDELQGQASLFKDSKKKLGTLKRQASGDRWLLWGGLFIFLAVAAYVGYKRAPLPVKAPIDMALRLGFQGVSVLAKHAKTGLTQAYLAAKNVARPNPPSAAESYHDGSGAPSGPSSPPPGLGHPSSQPPNHSSQPLDPDLHPGDVPLSSYPQDSWREPEPDLVLELEPVPPRDDPPPGSAWGIGVPARKEELAEADPSSDVAQADQPTHSHAPDADAYVGGPGNGRLGSNSSATAAEVQRGDVEDLGFSAEGDKTVSTEVAEVGEVGEVGEGNGSSRVSGVVGKAADAGDPHDLTFDLPHPTLPETQGIDLVPEPDADPSLPSDAESSGPARGDPSRGVTGGGGRGARISSNGRSRPQQQPQQRPPRGGGRPQPGFPRGGRPGGRAEPFPGGGAELHTSPSPDDPSLLLPPPPPLEDLKVGADGSFPTPPLPSFEEGFKGGVEVDGVVSIPLTNPDDLRRAAVLAAVEGAAALPGLDPSLDPTHMVASSQGLDGPHLQHHAPPLPSSTTTLHGHHDPPLPASMLLPPEGNGAPAEPPPADASSTDSGEGMPVDPDVMMGAEPGEELGVDINVPHSASSLGQVDAALAAANAAIEAALIADDAKVDMSVDTQPSVDVEVHITGKGPVDAALRAAEEAIQALRSEGVRQWEVANVPSGNPVADARPPSPGEGDGAAGRGPVLDSLSEDSVPSTEAQAEGLKPRSVQSAFSDSVPLEQGPLDVAGVLQREDLPGDGTGDGQAPILVVDVHVHEDREVERDKDPIVFAEIRGVGDNDKAGSRVNTALDATLEDVKTAGLHWTEAPDSVPELDVLLGSDELPGLDVLPADLDVLPESDVLLADLDVLPGADVLAELHRKETPGHLVSGSDSSGLEISVEKLPSSEKTLDQLPLQGGPCQLPLRGGPCLNSGGFSHASSSGQVTPYFIHLSAGAVLESGASGVEAARGEAPDRDGDAVTQGAVTQGAVTLEGAGEQADASLPGESSWLGESAVPEGGIATNGELLSVQPPFSEAGAESNHESAVDATVSLEVAEVDDAWVVGRDVAADFAADVLPERDVPEGSALIKEDQVVEIEEKQKAMEGDVSVDVAWGGAAAAAAAAAAVDVKAEENRKAREAWDTWAASVGPDVVADYLASLERDDASGGEAPAASGEGSLTNSDDVGGFWV